MITRLLTEPDGWVHTMIEQDGVPPNFEPQEGEHVLWTPLPPDTPFELLWVDRESGQLCSPRRTDLIRRRMEDLGYPADRVRAREASPRSALPDIPDDVATRLERRTRVAEEDRGGTRP